MSKIVVSYKEVVVKRPVSYRYTCDTCGYEFKKRERKVTYYSAEGRQYACYDKPCSPFSRPEGYKLVWDVARQSDVWEEV